MHKIKVLFFATLRDKAGVKSAEFEVQEGTTISGLKKVIEEKFSGIGPTLQTAVMSVNKEFAFEQDEIPDGAEVAVFPPVSGG